MYLTVQDIIDGYTGSGFAPGAAYSHIRARARSLMQRAKRTTCEVPQCGYTRHVETAHIKAISTYEKSANIVDINAAINLAALCPTHHWEFDNGFLKMTPTGFEPA